MNQKKIFLSAIIALSSVLSYSQEDSISLKEVVISDTKFSLSKEKSGKIIEKLSATDLQKMNGMSVAQVLSTVAGIEINGNNSVPGKNLSYYIRGGRSRQVVIMIDGIPMNDASGINLEFDLRLLPLQDIESIEIMKGASSTLYGTGAATGIINIKLKKNSVKPLAGNAYISLGTNNKTSNFASKVREIEQGLSLSGTKNKWFYKASINAFKASGISQGAEMSNEKFEDDPFSRINTSSQLGYQFNDNIKLEGFAHYDRFKTDFDNSFDNLTPIDTEINTTTSEQLRTGLSFNWKYKKGEFSLVSGYTTIERNFSQLNTFSNSVDVSLFNSRNMNVDAFTKYNFSKSLFAVTGFQFQFFDMNNETPFSSIVNEKANFNLIDPYASLVFTSNFGLNLNLGGRLNHHSVYGNNFIYHFNPSYSFSKIPLKVIASYSTAYITPSLYQLFSEFGNRNLTPEENATTEIGIETQLLSKKLTLTGVAFYRDETNAIDFFFNPDTFESFYINVEGTFKAKGIETTMKWQLLKNLKLTANYTFTQTEEALNRLIPKHKANATFAYEYKRGLTSIQYQWVDVRRDSFFNLPTFEVLNQNLAPYQLVSLYSQYDIIKNRLVLNGGVFNLFNENFQETIGFNTRGRNVRLGMQFKF